MLADLPAWLPASPRLPTVVEANRWFIGLLALEIVFNIALYLRGGWTWLFAIANTALNLAFAIPALWLWFDGKVFDPGLVAAFAELGLTEAIRPAGIVIAVVVVAGTAWTSSTASSSRPARRVPR